MSFALGCFVPTSSRKSTLGAEKFFDIKCRTGGLEPAAAVVVATVRALKMHGGVALADLKTENAEAVARGAENLEKHVENVRRFGVPPVVAINKFATDTNAEIAAVADACRRMDVPVALADVHAQGGNGALELADAVMDVVAHGGARFAPLYELHQPLAAKIERIAKDIYGADGVDYTPGAKRDLDKLEAIGLGNVPVCMAKTQYSFSDDPKRLGRPRGFRITVREVTPSAGAGFVVAKTGDIMTMPGLPKKPAAEGMRIEEDGGIVGLF